MESGSVVGIVRLRITLEVIVISRVVIEVMATGILERIVVVVYAVLGYW